MVVIPLTCSPSSAEDTIRGFLLAIWIDKIIITIASSGSSEAETKSYQANPVVEILVNMEIED
jgi:hypothetical protein